MPLTDSGTERWSRTVLLFAPAAYLIEVILGGPASLKVAPVRYPLFVAATGSLAILWLLRPSIPTSALRPCLAVFGFFVLNLIWATLVPTIQGTDLLNSFDEAKAYLLVPPAILFAIQAVRDPQLFRRFQRIVIISTVILASVQSMIWVVGTVWPELRVPTIVGLNLIFRRPESIYVGPMPDGFFRVFWISSLWTLPSFFWALSGVMSPRARLPVSAVLLFAIVVSYSRGVWVALVLGLIAMLLVRVVQGHVPRLRPGHLVAAGIGVAVIGGALLWSGELERAGERLASTIETEDRSIGVRVEQVPHLLTLWRQHPILGGGYGAYSPSHIRDVRAPYSYENMPYAILAKLGVLGGTIFFGGLGLIALAAMAVHESRTRHEAGYFVGAAAATLTAALTNPMLINFIGMTIICALLVQWTLLMSGTVAAAGSRS